MTEYSPKQHHDRGDTLAWDEDIPADKMERLRGGEVFTLLDADGKPHSRILMDSFNTIRQGPVDPPADVGEVIRSVLGIPRSPYARRPA